MASPNMPLAFEQDVKHFDLEVFTILGYLYSAVLSQDDTDCLILFNIKFVFCT